MLINDAILEIKNHESISIHKSAIDILRILKNNKALFKKEINNDVLNHLISNFEQLAYENPNEYITESYKRDFQTHYNLLLFYLNKII
jgi:hypothetical protein